MSTVQYEVECDQCGFPDACKEFDGRSYDYEVWCTRCGFRESWKTKSLFANGHLECGVKEVIYSAGACFIKRTDGSGTYGRLSEGDVETIAAKMRADIAAGELSPGSFVTRYNFETREVTALVGQVPMHDPAEQESDLGEETSEAEGGQEEDDLAFEV